MIDKAYCQNLLKEYLPKDGPLSQEIEYCLNSGGKRMRMILCLQIAEKLDVLCDNVKRIAVAIELVHNYSLVHDDLPCMDNDDERRGMPTCHKKYGQASAVLTGDALLNLAMEVALSGDFDQLGYADAVRNLFSSTGTSG
ncbi:MAG: polyprenyl synthetase family protein, partial [Clostridia bacterium]|nr:polyprenyl synthetase family protein [Clostridia bacterium]